MAERFLFDQVFAEEAGKERPKAAYAAAKPAAPRERPKRAFKPEEVEAIRIAAYDHGKRDALAEAERRTARLLEQLAKSLHELSTTIRFETERQRDEAARLAFAVASRFSYAAAAAEPAEQLEFMFGSCLDVFRREPKIVIEIGPAEAERIVPRLEAFFERQNLAGFVRVVMMKEASGTAARIEWAEGGAELSLDEGLKTVETIIESYFEALKSAPKEDIEFESAAARRAD